MPCLLCRHILPTGLRCGAPALTGGAFCYFHCTLHGRHRDLGRAILNSRTVTCLHLPQLEDREAIQAALSTVVAALAAGQLEPKRASALLYGLQLAVTNSETLEP